MSSRAPEAAGVVPGSVVADKYRVERILGQGGMGFVVEAHHVVLDERVALKFLLPEHASIPDAAIRFIREARAAAKIKSEHVARVFDVGRLPGGLPFMVMEYLHGADMAVVLERRGRLPVEEAVDCVLQACDAIAEAHRHGIVHRDLKPANLFSSVRPDGSPIVKVLDFGISKVLGTHVPALTRTSSTIGSVLYMAPEQMQAAKGVDARADVYALGVTLYELLAGAPPFAGESMGELCAAILAGEPAPLRARAPHVPAELEAVIRRAMARDRDERVQSVGELALALAAFASANAAVLIQRIARLTGRSPPAVGPGGSGTIPMPRAAAAVHALAGEAPPSQAQARTDAGWGTKSAPIAVPVKSSSRWSAIAVLLALSAAAVVVGWRWWGRGLGTPSASSETAPASAPAEPMVVEAPAESAPAIASTPEPQPPAAPSSSASAVATPRPARPPARLPSSPVSSRPSNPPPNPSPPPTHEPPESQR